MTRNAFLAFAALTILCPCAAQAQSSAAVPMRIGTHEGYTRAVFDWPAAVPYSVEEKEPGELVITFRSHSGLADGAPDGSGNIHSVSRVSDPDQDLAVTLSIAPGSAYRHFLVGSKVVIDVLDNKGAEKAEPAPAAQKKPDVKNSGPPVKAVKAEPVESAAVEDPPAPVKSVLQEASEHVSLTPHVVSLSATEALGLAAFVRQGYLWLVADRPGLTVPPQIAGETPSLFGAFEPIPVQGGTAWRTKLPPEALAAHLYGEGGGLVWRIVVTPNAREDAKPLEMTRSYSEAGATRGGEVSWPMTTAKRVLDLSDPGTGTVIEAVPVYKADQFAGDGRNMVDFDVLPTIIGLALVPKADDLTVSSGHGFVKVGRPGGLALAPLRDVRRSRIREEIQNAAALEKADEETEAADSTTDKAAEPEEGRIFDFDRWTMGGLSALEENQRILLSGLADKDAGGRVQDLLALAKMNIANDRGQEALGFLSFAESELPDIGESPEFIALRGAAAALAGSFQPAFKDLFIPALKDYRELDYWRAFTLAGLEDWEQAAATMPDDFSVPASYPRPLFEKMGIRLGEVALRAGKVPMAEEILATLQKERGTLRPWTAAALDYLKGEASRQNGRTEEAEKLWEPLVSGNDDFYRVKAALALTFLQTEQENADTDKIIDRLEGLRYAWRGDELEARINLLLGRLYLKKQNYIKGLGIMRDAIGMSEDTDIGREIAADMKNSFYSLLMDDADISPLDAAEIYEEFRELTPSGAEGDQLVQKLAERLVQADLLDRASDLLAHQVDYRLEGEDKARVALRLGAISLINKDARKAMKYLATGRDLYDKLLTGAEHDAKLKEIDLLRAKGLAQLNRTEEAIALLNGFDPDPAVNRLRADIAWQAGLWEDAAEALQDLILDQAIDLNRPLTQEQADLILHHAVALNLSGNRVALNNTRRRYEEAMKKTPRARLFDIVTRPRKTAIMADKDTIESIVKEVDLFADFLKTYREDAGTASN